MNPQQVIDVLNKLLSPAARVAWGAVVRQQYVIGVQEVVGAALFGTLVYGCWRWQKKLRPSKDWDSEEIALFRGVAIVLAVVFALVGTWFCMDGIGHFVNPYAGAINQLLHGQ